jgi:E1 N-terminal domain/ThiF family
MADDRLNVSAKRENALALAAALGVTMNMAAAMLDVRILITAALDDPTASALAADVTTLLERTVSDVSGGTSPTADVQAEIVIGAAQARTTALIIRVTVSHDGAVIGRTVTQQERCAAIPGLLVRLTACYVAAAALQAILGAQAIYQGPDPLALRFDELGLTQEQLSSPIDIGHAYLAGAGAIANGLLWAAEHVDLRGTLTIADDDIVSPGNLNRQILFLPEDIGCPKAERLAVRAASLVSHLILQPFRGRLQDLSERREGPWLRRLIVAVDSRRSRRELQHELPGEVFDASTTDVREVVIHHQRQPTTSACMGCIYLPDEEEYTREHHIADQLGVTVEEVRTERIGPAAAARIIHRYPTLVTEHITGLAYDTLFKRLCAEAALQTTSGQRVLAPFGFVSCLAGILLLVELIRRLAPGAPRHADNYWRVSAWHPPISRRRTIRPKESACDTCSSSTLSAVNAKLWPA